MRSRTPSAMRAPSLAPGITPSVSTRKIAQSMFPRSAWTIVPGITRIAITSSEVPSARRSGIPIQIVRAGTITIPPPTPSSPETNPASSPIAAYFHPGVSPRTHGVRGVRPTITWTAVIAIRPAVTRSNRCAFTTSVSNAPTIAPPTPGSAAHSGGAEAHLARLRVRVRAHERGRQDDGQRRRDRLDRGPAQDRVHGRGRDDPAADAEQTRQDPGAEPHGDAERRLQRRHASRSTARSMTSRSPLYAARLTAERSGNHRTSSISVS